MEFKKINRESTFSEIKDYCSLSGENDYIEVTEWSNGEGFSINVYSRSNQTLDITYGQWVLLKKMMKFMLKK